MRLPFLAAATPLLLVTLASAQTEIDAPSKLPIEVPHGASVGFEADAPGKEVVPLLKQFTSLRGGETERDADKFVLKTAAGNVRVGFNDLMEMLRPVREVHVVSYTADKRQDAAPLARYEVAFAKEGLERLGPAGDSGVLVMRRMGTVPQYAMVFQRNQGITVIRTDGMPDFAVAGRIVGSAIGDAIGKVLGGDHR